MDGSADFESLYTRTLLETPKAIAIKERIVFLYPATLGTMTLVSNKLKSLDIDHALLQMQPTMEILRLCTVYPEETAQIIATRTSKGKDEIFSDTFVEKYKFFSSIELEDRAILLEMILEPDHTDELLKGLQIERELTAMRVARKAKKKDRNTLSFGGASIYGSLIEPACEKYGWTYDYVVWGITYTNLQLIMADAVKELYLTDKEAKRATILPHGNKSQKAEGLTADQIREKFYNKK